MAVASMLSYTGSPTGTGRIGLPALSPSQQQQQLVGELNALRTEIAGMCSMLVLHAGQGRSYEQPGGLTGVPLVLPCIMHACERATTYPSTHPLTGVESVLGYMKRSEPMLAMPGKTGPLAAQLRSLTDRRSTSEARSRSGSAGGGGSPGSPARSGDNMSRSQNLASAGGAADEGPRSPQGFHQLTQDLKKSR
jgi:hypothetical protein